MTYKEWTEQTDDHGTDLSPEALGDAIDAAEILIDFFGETDENMADGETELEKAWDLCESHGYLVVERSAYQVLQDLAVKEKEYRVSLEHAMRVIDMIKESFEEEEE